MKKIVFGIIGLLSISMAALSQNLQLHYDFGRADDGDVRKDREYFTSTVEMFKPDSLGYTFFFVDIDYNGKNGASFAYGEIVRGFNIPGASFVKLELSYNGGVGFVNNTWLAGPTFPISFKNGFGSISAYYRAEKFQKSSNAQVTAVWSLFLCKGKIKFNGFLDVWTQNNFVEGKGKMVTFLAEPQLWYNLNSHFAIGGEVELSKNFFTFDHQFEAMPTTAIKWTF